MDVVVVVECCTLCDLRFVESSSFVLVLIEFAVAILVAFDVDVVDVAFGCVCYCGCFVVRFDICCGGISF